MLDPFAGSGTTGHAVLQLNKDSGADRRFILIEQGRPEKGDPYARSLMANRLKRVIEGDWANGKGQPTGGGYRFCQLQKKVDAKALLEMERDEMTDAVIASHYDANRRGGPGLIIMTNEGYDYLVARNCGGRRVLSRLGRLARAAGVRRGDVRRRRQRGDQGEAEAGVPRVRPLQLLPVRRRPLLPDTRPDTHRLRCQHERAIQQRIRHRMLTLFEFQHKAVDTDHREVRGLSGQPAGADRGDEGYLRPLLPGARLHHRERQDGHHGAGRSRAAAHAAVRPIVLWLSKGRVVVDQTLANLSGKYQHLLADYEDVQLLADYSTSDVEDDDLALVYVATVGTFNRKSKDKSSLRLFHSDIDNADQSTWNALKERMTSSGIRRPLIIVYDEAHNLTDQQTDLLMELEPDAMLLATRRLGCRRRSLAGHRRPQARPARGPTPDLTTYVKSADVVDAGLVKRQVLLGGYQAQMDETIDDLLADMAEAYKAVTALGLSLTPKAIYVCRTNIVEGNATEAGRPEAALLQREAPPILIWNYLVNEKGVDPATIAVYTQRLKFDKDYPPPADFVHFKGGDADYANFVAGDYRHIIFNLGLQEGWDDPECYFAYIDKSMQSNIQVEQVIGRVLRQPNAQHFEAEILNTAHFYVRVDAKGVFADIVNEVE